jgi:hypothetical protein
VGSIAYDLPISRYCRADAILSVMGHLPDDAIANLAVPLDHESLVHKLLPTVKEFLFKRLP